ncbi:MAG TPA: SIMPL domain-containing protein [Bacilli bacterium]|nr:SIMPL domain-containing protein [Bacilli bacterium]
MKKYWLLLIMSLRLFGQEEITIKSHASIEYPIDKVALVINISSTDLDKSKAEEINYNKSIKILNMLDSLGYKKSSIITLDSRISGSKNRDNKDEYTSRSSYSFVLTDLKLFDEIKRILLENDVESISYQKISDNEDKYKKEAYQKALDEAQKNAELIVQKFGKNKVKLKEIVDGGVRYRDRQQQLKNQLLGESSIGITSALQGQAVTVQPRESTITKLTETTSVDLLIVFEVTK